MRRLYLLATFGVLVACPDHAVYAQQVDCAANEVLAASFSTLNRLNALYRTDCLGGASDREALTTSATKALPPTLRDAASKAEIRLVALSVLIPVLKAVRSERDNLTLAAPQRAMLSALDSSIALAQGALDAGLSAVEVKLLGTAPWKWEPNDSSFGGLPIQLASTVIDACAVPTAATCKSAEQTARFVLRAAKLVERALAYNGRPLLVAALATTTMRDARWTAYFDETLVQFPWELALNSAQFRRAARAMSGFAMPPSHQWVLLHPMAGVEYVWSAPQGSRLTPTAAIEVVGYNRWWWNDSNRPGRALGVSVVAAFSDRANTSGMGFGVLVRYAHKYALTVTGRGGRGGILLSSDLGSWLTGKQEAAKNAMRLKLP